MAKHPQTPASSDASTHSAAAAAFDKVDDLAGEAATASAYSELDDARAEITRLRYELDAARAEIARLRYELDAQHARRSRGRVDRTTRAFELSALAGAVRVGHNDALAAAVKELSAAILADLKADVLAQAEEPSGL